MPPTRRAYDALVQWAAAAHDDVLRKLASSRYEPLAQDSFSTKGTRFRVSPCRLFAYLAAALSLLLMFVVYTGGGSFSSGFDTSRTTISKEDFIAAVVRDPVEGLLDLGPIQQKCNETKFQDGLVWECAPVNGGIGNVVNMVLNCVRYAVEAGGNYVSFTCSVSCSRPL